MIVDHISHLEQYSFLGENFRTAIRFILDTDVNALPAGQHEVDGDRVFVSVLERDLTEKPTVWEKHERYADIHLIMEGSETIGYCAQETCGQEFVFSEGSDCVMAEGLTGSMIELRAGEFLIALPQDVHQPNGPLEGYSKKLMVKILMD